MGRHIFQDEIENARVHTKVDIGRQVVGLFAYEARLNHANMLWVDTINTQEVILAPLIVSDPEVHACQNVSDNLDECAKSLSLIKSHSPLQCTLIQFATLALF